jgi:hypothetical protein
LIKNVVRSELLRLKPFPCNAPVFQNFIPSGGEILSLQALPFVYFSVNYMLFINGL